MRPVFFNLTRIGRTCLRPQYCLCLYCGVALRPLLKAMILRYCLKPPDDGGRSAQYGGPGGPLSVSDYNNDSTQTGPDTHIDIYRFPTKRLGTNMGVRTLAQRSVSQPL